MAADLIFVEVYFYHPRFNTLNPNRFPELSVVLAQRILWQPLSGERLASRTGKNSLQAMRRLTALLYFLTALCLNAHPVHTATAEAEYNPHTKKMEVSLTVFVSDLERALMRQSEREMRIDKTPAAEFDAQVLAYLKKTFVVTDAAGKVGKMTWVGREMEKESEKSGDPAVVLFFEVEVPGVEGASLRCAVFGELFEDQVNLVEMRSGARKGMLRFTRERASQKLLLSE